MFQFRLRQTGRDLDLNRLAQRQYPVMYGPSLRSNCKRNLSTIILIWNPVNETPAGKPIERSTDLRAVDKQTLAQTTGRCRRARIQQR